MTQLETRTEPMVVNFGPHHPSMHGVLRLVVTLDGEDVVDCEPVIGYLHRGMEKIAENRTNVMFVPYVSRMDYAAGMFYEAIVVNKSTVPVGYVRHARERFSTERILFSPEFLREGAAIEDFKRPDRIVVGSFRDEDGAAVEELYRGIEADVVRFSSFEDLQAAPDAAVRGKITFRGPAQFMPGVANSTDLRGSLAVLMAALCARGRSVVQDVHMALRGYNNLEEKLTQLGSRISVHEDMPLQAANG